MSTAAMIIPPAMEKGGVSDFMAAQASDARGENQ
jgi:hypothetical protein